jgi:carbon monoxide dehydrogenase subunit G
MATVQESVEVNVPLSQAYNQWTQFEEFPLFMSGVESVSQLDDTTVHFKTSISGVRTGACHGKALMNHGTPAPSGSRTSAGPIPR